MILTAQKRLFDFRKPAGFVEDVNGAGIFRAIVQMRTSVVTRISYKYFAFSAILLAASTIKAEDQPLECEHDEHSVGYGGNQLNPKTLFRWSWAGPPVEAPDEEEDVLVTDRPDFTEASSTVGMGRLQVEMGYTFTRDDDAGNRVDTHSYPETLFRIGMLAEWFEFRLAYNYLNENATDAGGAQTRFRGSDDLYLGAKLWLTEQQGWLPEMVLMPQMFVPSGADDFSNEQVLPGVNWLYSWEINETVVLAGSTQINAVRDATEHTFVEMAQSVALGISLSDQLSAYAEYFGFYPTGAIEADLGALHFFNSGLTYLVNNDLQLDWRIGFGLNDDADDLFTGVGLSARF